MVKQETFSGLAWKNKGRKTRREKFLEEMNTIIPWQRLLKVAAPHYSNGQQGRPPYSLQKMIRIYLLQIWFDLSDPAAEDAIYDSESTSRFVAVDLPHDRIPDETTIQQFRVIHHARFV